MKGQLTAATAVRNHVRSEKVYRLKAGVPAGVRPGSTARTILTVIGRQRGRATALTVRKAMKRGTPDATVRFYLGKFQREGIVVSSAATA